MTRTSSNSILIFSILGLSVLLAGFSFMPDVFAQSNPNLYVSAENPQFDNVFNGPMVIEVVVTDKEISKTNVEVEEPDVTVNGKTLRMVQAVDGNWYAYFAVLSQAQIADSTVGLPGFGLDFGEFCEPTSFVAGISLSDTDGFSISRDIATGSNGEDALGTCTDTVSDTDALVNHVVRESKLINQNSPDVGQIGIDPDVWPLIQFYDIFQSQSAIVQYSKGGGTQSVHLFFDEADHIADSFFDRPTYPKNAPVYLRVTDIQLNIDPTDNDSWTFGTNPTAPTTFYQIFDENGQTDADGTLGAVDISNKLQDFFFEDSGLLLIDTDAQGTGSDVVNFADNDYQQIISGPTAFDAVSVGGTFTEGTQPVTLTENSENSGIFVNFDSSGVPNIVTTDVLFGISATVDYNDSPHSIVVVDTSDAFVSALINSNQKSFFVGDTVSITGTVTPLFEIFPLVITVTNPENAIVYSNQVTPSDDGTFSDQIMMTDKNWETLGNYKITLSYLDAITELPFTLDTDDPGIDVVKSLQKISKTEGGGPSDATHLFGEAVAYIGDLDNDGVGDLAVGDRGISDVNLAAGGLWILFLNADGTVKDSQKISETQGGFTGLLERSDWFGSSISSIGDIDGDGVTDIAVGAYGNDDGGNNAGAIWILFLNTDGTVKANQKISNTAGGLGNILSTGDSFGFSVSKIGDLDGDNINDVAVGAIGDNDGGNGGAIWILFLNTDGTVKDSQKISETQGGFTGDIFNAALFGYSVSEIGDLDGDNINDVAVGLGLDNEIDNPKITGAVWILFLNTDGTVKANQKISETQGGFTGILDEREIFGSALSGIGDFNGDGINDLVVGAHADDDGGQNTGAIWLLLMNPDGTVKNSQKISELKGGLDDILNDFNFFGKTIANLGDFNNDGITDIAVGSGNAPELRILFLDSIEFTIESLITDIDTLVDEGNLDKKDAKKLTKKLNKVNKEFGKDKIDKACKETDKFIKEVNKLVKKGKLAQTDAETLIESAQSIKPSLGCT